MNELKENKNLMKMGEGGSSEGSDSAPSEDNLAAADLIKNLPVDKTLKQKIKKEEKDKQNTKRKELNIKNTKRA